MDFSNGSSYDVNVQELQRSLRNSISEGQSTKEIIAELRENVKKHGLSEPEAVSMIWAAVMSACEWNKKEDLLQEQVPILVSQPTLSLGGDRKPVIKSFF